MDNEGTTMMLKVVAYVIPKSSVRLFSPQDMLIQNRTGSFNLYWNMVELDFKVINLKVPYNCSKHIPMLTLDINENFNQYKIDSIKTTVLAKTSVLIKENLHLSRPQKELLLWHWKLGHANIRWIQSLFKPRKYI